MIFERVRRCHFCKREMSCSAIEYAENPFCVVCLEDRIRAASPSVEVQWRFEGNYLIPVDARTPT